MYRFAIVAASAVLAVGACQSTDPYYGSGSISLSPKIERCLERYLARQTPLHLAVAEDGRSGCGYTYCYDFNCGHSLPGHALAICEQRSKGVPCKIYAVERHVVWRGAGAGSRSNASFAADTEPDVSCRSRIGVVSKMKPHLCRKFGGEVVGETVRSPVAVTWIGYDKSFAGEMEYREHDGRGTVSMELPGGEGNCEGRYEFTEKRQGVWSVACANGLAASGVFETHGESRGTTGVGKDTKGREVRFTMGGR